MSYAKTAAEPIEMPLGLKWAKGTMYSLGISHWKGHFWEGGIVRYGEYLA